MNFYVDKLTRWWSVVEVLETDGRVGEPARVLHGGCAAFAVQLDGMC